MECFKTLTTSGIIAVRAFTTFEFLEAFFTFPIFGFKVVDIFLQKDYDKQEEQEDGHGKHVLDCDK